MLHIAIPARREGKSLAARIMTPANYLRVERIDRRQALDCGCDDCDPDQGNGFRTFMAQVTGLAAGAVIVGLIEAAHAILPLIESLTS